MLSKMDGAKIAVADTDSFMSSIINTDLDAMSFMKYDEESMPPEFFNLIEEYSDKGLGGLELNL